MIDLGAWLSEQRSIPADATHSESESEGGLPEDGSP